MDLSRQDPLRTIDRHSRRIILGALLITLLLGTGLAGLDGQLAVGSFAAGSTTEEAEAVSETFATENRSVTLVVLHDGEVLERPSLAETFALQSAIRANETIAPTLHDPRPTADAGTIFVETYLRQQGSFHELSLEDKRRTFRTFDADDLDEELASTVLDDGAMIDPVTPASALFPADYPGHGDADARLVMVFHDAGDDDAMLAAQAAVEELADEHVTTAETFVFGEQLVQERTSAATGTAMSTIGPVILVLVILLLAVGYRDIVDVTLSLVGIALVLLWTAGFVGWTPIPLTQLLVAVPWLVLGLAIDYGLHVLLRYREATDQGRGVGSAGMGAVLVAIGMTTVTTAIGFLSGVISPMPVIREFGLVTAFGVVATLVVFGTVIPALRIEYDTRLRRSPRPDGLHWTPAVASIGVRAARTSPLTLVMIALVLSGGAVYGASQVDTSMDRTDFYPDETPHWWGNSSDDPDDPTLRQQILLLDDRFGTTGADEHIDVVIRGEVTSDAGVDAMASVEAKASESPVTHRSEDAVITPYDVLERFAPFDPTVQAVIDEDDGIDRDVSGENLTAAFNATERMAPDAFGTVVSRDGDEFDAVRIIVRIQSGADPAVVAEEFESIATDVDAETDVSVTASGGPMIVAETRAALFETLVTSFLGTLLVTGSVLLVLYHVRYGAAWLAIPAIGSVLIALTWVLGIMAWRDIPFNAETAIITGIGIGLGLDFAIHVITSYREELSGGSVIEALSISARRTGGIIVMSAGTTALAVGALLLTPIPSLRRFGLLVVLVVGAAAVTAIVVLPSLLVLGHRMFEE